MRRIVRSAVAGGATALLLCQTALAQVIPNPSFEADTFSAFPGYISANSPITGWTGTPTNRVGINPGGGSPFADNGTKPNGANVAFIQNNQDDASIPSTLSTTISGLTVGTTYTVTFRANARSGNVPYAKVFIDGVAVLLPGGPDGLTVAPVAGSNPYWHLAFDFTATAASQTMSIVNDADFTKDHTLLVDDFKIAPSTGKWSVAAWTDDTDSGVDSSFLYTHAYNLGSSANVVINDVTFTGLGGNGPAVPGRFSTTYLGTGPVHDSSVSVGGNGAAMAGDFVYGGNVPAGLYQSIALQGLTAGMEYILTVYSVAWEDPVVASRWAVFNVGDDYRTVNQDQFLNNNGIRVSYRYVADASGGMTLKFAPFIPQNVSFHVYGFANREAVSRFVAPAITAQPKSQIVSPDLPVTFSVAATGLPLPAYQWRFNGVAIPNATDATLTLPGVTAVDVGAYDVVLTNRAGAVTSESARLTIGIPLTNPSFEMDFFSVFPGYVRVNFPITGWNSLGGHGINPSPSSPFADNGVIPHGSQVAFMQDNGALSQTVSGLTVGSQYYVHFFANGRSGSTAPAMEVTVGGVTVLPARAVAAVGGANSYQEMSTEVFVASSDTTELAFIKSNPEGGDTTLLIDNVAVVPVQSGTAPTVGVQPQSMTVYTGQPANFGAVAQGSLPLHYQWMLNGVAVPGATNNTLSLVAAGLSDEGSYTLVVTNSSGTTTSRIARLSLLEVISTLRSTGIGAGGAPLAGGLVDPDWTLIVNPDGGSTTAYVGNDGWPILAGTWMVNSGASKWIGSRPDVGGANPVGTYIYRTTLDLTGRDTNTVIIVGRWATDDLGNGVYVNGNIVSVPLANSFGNWTTFTLTSSNAPFVNGINTIDFGMSNGGVGPSGLRVEFTQTSARTLPGIPAAIGIQPLGSSSLAEGDNVVISVVATGTLPITYQWRKDGSDLPGKTDASITLTSVTTNSAGNYSVRVANPWGSAVSVEATLTVAYRPLPGFFGTGVDANHQAIAEGLTDPHYILSVSADPAYPGPNAVVVSNAWPVAPAGPWLANGPRSSWIAPQPDQNQIANPASANVAGDYTYQTAFDLTGQDVSKVKVLLGIAADNTVTDVLLNGVSLGITAAGFDSFKNFTISTGLLAGANTLDFILHNDNTDPTGLRVDLKGYLSLLQAAAPARLQIGLSGANVVISWSPVAAGQKLQSAPAVSGPWTEIPSATNPYTTPASGSRVFYRIVQ